MDLKSNLLVGFASALWLAAPAALSQPPPETPDVTEPQTSPSQDQSAPQDASASQDSSAAPDESASQGSSGDLGQGAQTQEPAAPAPSMGNAVVIDDQKLEQFANAYIEVQNIQQKAANDLQATTDPAAADKVKATAQQDMISAVERSGLHVDEFNQIVQSMASNVDIRNRVAAKLQERSGG
ncbi:MAG TPA: DUF4168 domain-containing protein [Steroidobacter sp.]|nr:DUF4168 domain-containing protein [Steroidobacter sp.]